MLRPFSPQVRAAPSGAAAIGVLLLLACGSGSCRSTTSSGDPAARDTAQHDVVIAVAWPWERRTQIHYGEGLDLAVEEENAGGGLEGRRIRVAVSSSNSPRFEANPNTGRPFRADKETRVAMNTLHLSRRYPSRIVLPLYPAANGP